MDRPFVGGARVEAPDSGGTGRADLAMTILQYGTALVAFVAATLLAIVR